MAKQPMNATDIRQVRKKEKLKKRLKKFIALGVVVVFGLGVYFSRDLWVPKLEGILDKPHDTIVNDGTLASGNFPLELQESSVNKLTTLGDELVQIDDSHIYFYDESGNLDNTINHSLANPIAEVSGKRMLLFDNGGYTFSVVNKNGELFSKTIDNTILYATMNDNQTAIVTQSDKFVSNMTVYDGDGNEIYKWSSSQRIIDIAIKDDGTGCYISTFTSVDGAFVSVIHEVDFDSTEEKMTSQSLDTLVLNICENAAGEIWAVGDTRLYKINGSGEITMNYEYTNDIVAYSVNDKVCAVAIDGVERKTSQMLIFNCDDESISGTVEITSGNVKSLLCVEQEVFMLSEKAIEDYDISGNLQATAAVSNDYVNFVYMDEAVYFSGYREINKIIFNT